jgi:hypothetical protein
VGLDWWQRRAPARRRRRSRRESDPRSSAEIRAWDVIAGGVPVLHRGMAVYAPIRAALGRKRRAHARDASAGRSQRGGRRGQSRGVARLRANRRQTDRHASRHPSFPLAGCSAHIVRRGTAVSGWNPSAAANPPSPAAFSSPAAFAPQALFPGHGVAGVAGLFRFNHSARLPPRFSANIRKTAASTTSRVKGTGWPASVLRAAAVVPVHCYFRDHPVSFVGGTVPVRSFSAVATGWRC